ncbi:MAG: hypothetical protein OXB93_05130 [Cytophagales bacterium]|nr:hypothetical protein [Cytophagales bacterium]
MNPPEEDFLCLDPPYANRGRLYGIRDDMHKEFPHDILAKELRTCRGWILGYNAEKNRDKGRVAYAEWEGRIEYLIGKYDFYSHRIKIA